MNISIPEYLLKMPQYLPNDIEGMIFTYPNKFPLIKQHPYVENGFIFDDNIYDFNKHIYHELGVYYLQEPSAMIVSSLIKPSIL